MTQVIFNIMMNEHIKISKCSKDQIKFALYYKQASSQCAHMLTSFIMQACSFLQSFNTIIYHQIYITIGVFCPKIVSQLLYFALQKCLNLSYQNYHHTKCLISKLLKYYVQRPFVNILMTQHKKRRKRKRQNCAENNHSQ